MVMIELVTATTSLGHYHSRDAALVDCLRASPLGGKGASSHGLFVEITLWSVVLLLIFLQ